MNGMKEFLHNGNVVLCNREAEAHSPNGNPAQEELSFADRCGHMLVLGPPGCGKTSMVVVPLCHQDILAHERGVTLFTHDRLVAREAAIMAEDAGRHYLLFDPGLDNCPCFNPLQGELYDVVEDVVQVYRLAARKDTLQRQELAESVLRKAVKVLKRLDVDKRVDGYYSTLILLSRLLNNYGGQGRELVQKFSRISAAAPDEARENADIASWFLNSYFIKGSSLYEQALGLRLWVDKLIENPVLRNVLNPDIEKGEFNQMDFDAILQQGYVACITTGAHFLSDANRTLGYLLMVRFQSACFRRISAVPMSKRSLFNPSKQAQLPREHSVYIDEAIHFITPMFGDTLVESGRANLALHIISSSISQMCIGMNEAQENRFADAMPHYIKNLVLFPGCSAKEVERLAAFYNAAKGPMPALEGLEHQPPGTVAYCIVKDGAAAQLRCGQLVPLNPAYLRRIKSKALNCFADAD